MNGFVKMGRCLFFVLLLISSTVSKGQIYKYIGLFRAGIGDGRLKLLSDETVESISTPVHEGKVALSTQQKETILHPDQQALLDKKTGKLLISNTKAAYSAEWTNDRLYFDEALLPDIVKELERSYNIKITIADAALNSVRFYGNFRRREQSIREIMDVLSSTDKMTYIIEGKNIVITLPE
jgi:ferric-dicitrate binding protein FerR (iron transport regulator)